MEAPELLCIGFHFVIRRTHFYVTIALLYK